MEKGNKSQVADHEVVTSYKGFHRDWSCRGFKYEVGKSYEHVEEVAVCKSGFHACEHPLHVFQYYRPGLSVFAVVEQRGTIRRHSEDSKIASSHIEIRAQLDLWDLVHAAVKHTTDRCTPADRAGIDKDHAAISTRADRKSATATGRYSAATVTGCASAAAVTGYASAAMAAGQSGVATASGSASAAMATGEYGTSKASGLCSAATATGDHSAAMATGEYGTAVVTGCASSALTTGDYGAAVAVGYCSAATATGYLSTAMASRHAGIATAAGPAGAAVATGRHGKVRGKDGCALFLTHRDDRAEITHVWAGIVGQNGIKADTWYLLGPEGKPEEVTLIA